MQALRPLVRATAARLESRATFTTRCVMIKSENGSFAVRVNESGSSNKFSSASVYVERDQEAQEVAGQTLRTFLDATAPAGFISRAEAVVGGRRLGLTKADVDAVFAALAHGTTALVDEADFLRACAQRSTAAHFSFASPDGDWCAPRAAEVASASAAAAAEVERLQASSSNVYDMSHLSFASPESDHSALRPAEFLAAQSEPPVDLSHLSWASPESDHTALRPAEFLAAQPLDLSHLSWASPESDFTGLSAGLAAPSQEAASPSLSAQQQQQQPAPRAASWLDYFTSLSFASPESDFTGPLHAPRLKSSLFLFEEEEHQEHQQAAAVEEGHFVSLLAQQELDMSPTQAAKQGFFTLDEALAPSMEARVLTKATAPFEICNVNDAWSNLCGFSGEEVQGKTLSVIQGSETAGAELDSLVAALKEGRSADVILTNYKRHGQAFTNHLQVRPVWDGGELTHFLGTLRDVSEHKTAAASSSS